MLNFNAYIHSHVIIAMLLRTLVVACVNDALICWSTFICSKALITSSSWRSLQWPTFQLACIINSSDHDPCRPNLLRFYFMMSLPC